MASSAATVENWHEREQLPNDAEQPTANEQEATHQTTTPNEQEPESQTTNPNDATRATKWQLSIAQGLHQGALVELREGELIVVGNGDDCDIQLFDADVAARHLALIMRDAVVTVRALDGAISINDKPLLAGVQHALNAGDKICLVQDNVQLLLARIAAEAADSEPETNSDSGTSTAPPKRSTGSLRWLLVPVMVLALVVVSAATVLGVFTRQSPNSMVDTQALQAILAELKLQDDVTIEEAANSVTLHGALGSEPLARLSEALSANNMRVRLRISSVEQLLERVRDVFRTNGYGAQLEYLGAGNVRVENLDGTNKTVQKIAEYVKQDVLDLRKLSFAPLEQADSAQEPELYIPPSGKRLTTIIDGDTAYVATEDGARYFTGSALPGGYHIRRITKAGVQADKDGVVTWLRF